MLTGKEAEVSINDGKATIKLEVPEPVKKPITEKITSLTSTKEVEFTKD